MEHRSKTLGAKFIERLGEESWTYIKTVVDIVHEPILILDKNLCVVAANQPFYTTFKVKPKETEGALVYKLGNGQWNIPVLKKLLEDVLPKNTFFKSFQVDHDFPSIGRKIMILNARQIYCKEDRTLEPCPPIILLAMEDITEMMSVAEKFTDHTNQFEAMFARRTQELEIHIKDLEEEISVLRKEPLSI